MLAQRPAQFPYVQMRVCGVLMQGLHSAAGGVRKRAAAPRKGKQASSSSSSNALFDAPLEQQLAAPAAARAPAASAKRPGIDMFKDSGYSLLTSGCSSLMQINTITLKGGLPFGGWAVMTSVWSVSTIGSCVTDRQYAICNMQHARPETQGRILFSPYATHHI